MTVMPLVPDTKVANVGKLISVKNLLGRKVTWLILTITSVSLILSRAFGTDSMTRIADVYSRLPRTHFSIWTYRGNTHSLSYILLSSVQPHENVYIPQPFFFLVLPFCLHLLLPQTQPQKFRQTLKETNNHHGIRHVSPRTRCYITIYHYLT